MQRNERSWIVVCGVVMVIALTVPLALAEISYEPGKRRDPFVALKADDASVTASSSGVKLEGIIYDPADRSMAILNGKTYQTGDMAGEAKVLQIKKDHVVIAVDGEEKTLWIRDELASGE